jgi:hypothetical protein
MSEELVEQLGLDVKASLPIGEQRSAELLSLIDPSAAPSFYASLAHNMTVMARVTIYSPELFDDRVARERLRLMNEMMHGITLQLASAMRGDRGYSAVDFCDSMFSKARDGGFEAEFDINEMSRTLWRFLGPD